MNKLTIILLSVVLVACSTALVQVPMPKPAFETSPDMISDKVLVVFDNEFVKHIHNEGQVLTIFQYDIGQYLSYAIKDSLSSTYETVDIKPGSVDKNEYDIVITPRLVRFEAPVPATVFQRTKSEIEIEYSVKPNTPLKPFVIRGFGDYELDTEEENIYKSLSVSDSDTPSTVEYYDLNTAIALPNYAYFAGKDTAIAVRQSLISLLSQLKEKLENI
ncbi:MAG: hypothetical protein OXS28_07330 [Gammaproteobacteria bacterium]|nr:hypothetical protein [Gammaproteobacteria bacterium]MDE0285579.1 hypothetical protein [Gammaproteobacteria bacterium]